MWSSGVAEQLIYTAAVETYNSKPVYIRVPCNQSKLNTLGSRTEKVPKHELGSKRYTTNSICAKFHATNFHIAMIKDMRTTSCYCHGDRLYNTSLQHSVNKTHPFTLEAGEKYI